MTLDAFLAQLDRFTSRVPLEYLDDLLAHVDIDLPALAPFARFNPGTYRRNLLRAGPAYHALLLCWRPGQRSPIHDHRGSSCGVRILTGTATETVFDRTPQGHVYPTLSRDLPTGYVCGRQDADIHQLSNLSETRDLISLHIYSPPLLTMGTYSLTAPASLDYTDPVHDYAEGAGI